MLESSLPEDQPVINLLESHVIDQIAAGEVVERPASIVKELVENSVDAGATSIQVDIEGGGLGRITVTDDGVGMGPNDLRRSWQRHATSKLLNPSDLFCIDTFGFRGEALSSIASVSEMTITTRRARDSVGLALKIKGGKLVSETPVGCPQGTSIDIQQLFYNTPARRKFLRSPATEQAHVVDACLRTTMGSRRVGLVLTSGRRRLVDVPADVRGRERIEIALGKRVGALCDFEYASEGVHVTGFRSGLEVDRGDSKGIWIFVNGRYVRDKMLQRAVIEAFRSMVQRGRYPIVVIFVDIDPETVDVNVHPQKLEVRFSEAAPVYRALASALAVSEEKIPLPTRKLEENKIRVEEATHRYLASERPISKTQPQPRKQLAQAPRPQQRSNDEHRSSGMSPAKPTPAPAERQLKPTAHQIEGEWVRPWEDVVGMALDDLFVFYSPTTARQELAFAALRLSQVVTQRRLMLPFPFSANANTLEALENAMPCIEALGASMESIGPGRYLLRAMPEVLGDLDGAVLVEKTLSVLPNLTGSVSLTSELVRAWVSVMPRGSAPLQLYEVRDLLEIDSAKGTGTHGFYRYPVTKVVSHAEVIHKTLPVV
ncbi:MAG: DNA mismatch repair endonuclease MutL [Deltaproteobacteria bacterium]|jgi:DNA mismatch repair protein MutL|nr:DNA mismatch repair endonuclease MutL [Deltaproteobacteria bacterium]MBT6433075.1 DNA mismatch repair endonuclease MutL [Deltaproteobacteria bacterium]MBT6489401.1 DNA mismatch repair endonuclease MutL [Deltaproteobacteria bacterium]